MWNYKSSRQHIFLTSIPQNLKFFSNYDIYSYCSLSERRAALIGLALFGVFFILTYPWPFIGSTIPLKSGYFFFNIDISSKFADAIESLTHWFDSNQTLIVLIPKFLL